MAGKKFLEMSVVERSHFIGVFFDAHRLFTSYVAPAKDPPFDSNGNFLDLFFY